MTRADLVILWRLTNDEVTIVLPSLHRPRAVIVKFCGMPAPQNRVVRIEIVPKLIASKEIAKDIFRCMVKDASGSEVPYGWVEFPREGLQKTGLLDNTAKQVVSFYAQVIPISAEVTTRCVALGTRFASASDGKATYRW